MSDASFDPKAFVAGLPALPGVYRMLGAAGEALYVGKARDLKKRVGSYFGRSGQSPRIAMMLGQVASIEVTLTRSEAEALLLENNLIKRLAPRFNILFRDDKSYPYLMLTGDRHPRLAFHRGAKDSRHRHFGPFPHAHAVRESMRLLQRVFRLRTCEDSVFENRSRPCLLHQIERCSAPCVGLIDERKYAEDVRDAALFLEGREGDVTRRLGERMQAAAEAQRYEEAAACRDRLRALARVQSRQFVESKTGIDADIAACALEAGRQGGLACVNLVMIRGGRHVGDRSYFPVNAGGATEAEVLEAFLDQHYLEQPVPVLVVTAPGVDLGALEEMLAHRAPHGLSVVAPAHGERRVWLDMAHRNAGLALAQRAAERGTQEGRLAALRDALGLPEAAERIECFDISHTMGEAAMAACVVYDRRQMQRPEYRRFDIRNVTGGDDYGAMRQALARRYARIVGGEGRMPDLVLIDGGRGQVNAAREALAEVGVSGLEIVGVAKGPERKAGLEELVFESDGATLRLPPTHPGLHLVQQIRDEAHRFAVAGHRAKRSRTRTASTLEEIPGIGTRRRQALLAHFGGLRGVQSAALDEIARVEGVSRALAERIYRHLHDKGQA